MTVHHAFTQPEQLLAGLGGPTTIEEWRAAAEAMLTERCCPFHRNMEISARYAWMYASHPDLLKWAGMAAFASHHVRLALFPLRLHTDSRGRLDLASRMRRRRLLSADANTVRETNNAIFDDIFWVHLAYVADDRGIERLRHLLGADGHYSQALTAFEAIDRGRRVLNDPGASTAERWGALDDIWRANTLILEHEQRAVVQPKFDRLSRAFAPLASLGSATSFDVGWTGRGSGYFTSFYGYSFTGGVRHLIRSRTWPLITRFDDRWRWLTTCVIPRFRRLDADARLVNASLQRIFEDASLYAETPCGEPISLPHPTRTAATLEVV